MFFSRNKPQDRQGMTDGLKDSIDTFVKEWGVLKREQREFVADGSEPVLKLLTDADVAYFVKGMEDEAARIEAEIGTQISDMKRQQLADIAQKDAQISAINREIEQAKARIAAQDAEVIQRADARANLLASVAKINPSLDTSELMKDAEIRRELVRSKFGDAAVNDRSEAYIDERFESLEAQANVDPFARVVADGLVSNVSVKDAADKAWHDMVADMNNAHRKH